MIECCNSTKSVIPGTRLEVGPFNNAVGRTASRPVSARNGVKPVVEDMDVLMANSAIGNFVCQLS